MPNHDISSVAFTSCILPITEDPWAVLIIVRTNVKIQTVLANNNHLKALSISFMGK